MSFGDHLDELRGRLIRALLGVAAGTLLAFVFGKDILALIFRPLWMVQAANGLQPSVQALSPTTAFSAYLKIAFFAGLILSMPWALYQIWKFVASGLYVRERRFATALVWPSAGLFVAGVLFLYFVVLPVVLQFFITFNRNFSMPDLTPSALQSWLLPKTVPASNTGEANAGEHRMRIPIVSIDPPDATVGDTWVNATTNRVVIQAPIGVWSAPLHQGAAAPGVDSQFAIDFYLSFVLMLALAFGIGFQTPVVVFFLAWTGLASAAAMAAARRYVLLAAVIIGAVLTPPDVLSQLFLAGPMYLLFELGLLAARAVERRRRESL